jgi:uncharacterized membrane protein YphA (DoxX/SURF4 family)
MRCAGAGEVTGVTRRPLAHLTGVTRRDQEERTMTTTTRLHDPTETAYWALRLTFGVIPIVAGLDKFTNLLANWEGYVSPLAARLLPVSPHAFMMLVGIIEIAVGIGVLSGRARVFGWIAAAWLLCIAVNLLATGRYFDVAARDVALAVSAFALAQLAPAHEAVRREVRPPEPGRRPAEVHA